MGRLNIFLPPGSERYTRAQSFGKARCMPGERRGGEGRKVSRSEKNRKWRGGMPHDFYHRFVSQAEQQETNILNKNLYFRHHYYTDI